MLPCSQICQFDRLKYNSMSIFPSRAYGSWEQRFCFHQGLAHSKCSVKSLLIQWMIQRNSLDQECWSLPPPGHLRVSALFKAYPALWHLVTCTLPPTSTPNPATAAGRPLGPKRTHWSNSLSWGSELRGAEMGWAGIRTIFIVGTE